MSGSVKKQEEYVSLDIVTTTVTANVEDLKFFENGVDCNSDSQMTHENIAECSHGLCLMFRFSVGNRHYKK